MNLQENISVLKKNRLYQDERVRVRSAAEGLNTRHPHPERHLIYQYARDQHPDPAAWRADLTRRIIIIVGQRTIFSVEQLYTSSKILS